MAVYLSSTKTAKKPGPRFKRSQDFGINDVYNVNYVLASRQVISACCLWCSRHSKYRYIQDLFFLLLADNREICVKYIHRYIQDLFFLLLANDREICVKYILEVSESKLLVIIVQRVAR